MPSTWLSWRELVPVIIPLASLLVSLISLLLAWRAFRATHRPKVAVYLRSLSPQQPASDFVVEVANLRSSKVQLLRVDLTAWSWHRLCWINWDGTWKQAKSGSGAGVQTHLRGYSAEAWRISQEAARQNLAQSAALPVRRLRAYAQLGNGKIVRSRQVLALSA